MASSGNLISCSNFDNTFASYSKTFYATSQYYFICAESWGIRAAVNAAFLNDWHGTMRLDRWTGSGWTNPYSTNMQDTSSAKSVAVRINASGLSISGSSYYYPGDQSCNLWRVRFVHSKWGGNYGVSVTVYIGDCRTAGESHYNSYLKGKPIYSNGTVGKSMCGVYDSGSSLASDATILSYFSSNRGTTIYGSYSRYCVGALRS